VSHKPCGRLPLLSASPAVTPATLKRAATSFAAWWTEAQWVWTVCLRLLPDSVATRFEPGPFILRVQHANHSATEPPWIHISDITPPARKFICLFYGQRHALSKLTKNSSYGFAATNCCENVFPDPIRLVQTCSVSLSAQHHSKWLYFSTKT